MTGPGGTRWHAAYALLPSGLARDVTFAAVGGRFTEVSVGSEPAGAQRLPGVVLPGLANCHSHAFHRALRGRTHDDGGTFWTWRERMYAVAARLDPDSYLALARATYAEMALAGITTVGEFHYLHHGRDGVPYADPNAMGHALRQAAAEAGVRLSLLDACYLHGGLDGTGHSEPQGVQRRFCDGSVDRWRARVGLLEESPGMRVGVAVHSVRAVDRGAARVVAATARDVPATAADRPLHVHLSEQPAENAASQAFYGCSPTELLDQAGALTGSTTAVHATHLSETDRSTLGRAAVHVCLCPTTERDLADGIAPARALADAGTRLCVGSDQQAVVDLFEEARGVEMHERLSSLRRGRFGPGELLGMATAHDALGWPDAGRLVVGARADLVAVRLDSVRTAGCDPAQVLLCATAADVDTVVVDGRVVATGGRHILGEVGPLLAGAINPLWEPQ